MTDTVGRPSAVRLVIVATALLAPLTALEIGLREPFMASTLAGTAAVALHDPIRFRVNRKRIASCYAFAIVVAAPLSLAGLALALPTVLTATIAAVVVAASPAGRTHPPTACVSFAVSSRLLGQAAVDWLVVAAAVGYLLLALDLLATMLSVRKPLLAPPANNHRSAARRQSVPSSG